MILKTKKGNKRTYEIGQNTELTVKTKKREVIVDSSLAKGIYDKPLNKLFGQDINPTYNQ